MPSTILGGDITVYYSDESRRKQLVWSGATTFPYTTYTLNQVYSALQDLFDDLGQMDDGTVMSAETPVEYTTGIIDSGDLDPWYVTYDLMEHIRGGALRTSSWQRDLPGDGTGNIGIVVVPVTSNTFDSGDVGSLVEHATGGDDGTLLEIIETGGSIDYLVIRPDTNALADDWNSTSGTVQIEGGGGNSATQDAAAVSSEQIWANLYSIGTIESDTHIYLYQGTVSDTTRSRKYSISNQSPDRDWWGDQHIDVCIYTRDFTQSGPSNVIDTGYIKAFARKGSSYYDNFETATSLTSGGRNPIPINTAADLDNPTGYKSITFTAGSGSWNVGNEITGDSSNARAIITQIDNPGSTQTLHYYLIGDPQINFQTAAEGVTNEDTAATGTKDGNAPADEGPGDSGWFTGAGTPSIAFTFDTYDIDDDGTDEWYGITVNCNGNPLSEIYEWLKYITRDGSRTTGGTYNVAYTDGITGEQYVGAEVYLKYSGAVSGGTIDEGDDVLQATTGATGIVISHDTTNKVLLLRDARGSFSTSNTVTSQDAGAGTITPDLAAATFAPNKQAPFGSFPGGGTFFGARGVLLENWDSGDENSFSLIPVNGGTKQRPQAFSITVANLIGTSEATITDDRVTVFRLTGENENINKAEYSAAGVEAIGDATIVIDTGGGITADTPGKTTGGVLRIRDDSANNANYRIRYSSWLGSTFTLANTTGTTTGGDENTLVDSGASFTTTAKRGDLVYNTQGGGAGRGYAYVTSVDNDNTLQLDRNITGQTTGDSYELNCVPIAMDTADDVYVPLIDRYAASSAESVSIRYILSNVIYFRARVRNVANATKIKPFEADSQLANTNVTVNTVRTADTIYVGS